MCPFWTGLLVFIGCGGPLLRCVVPSLLAWHSVMETTMVEPVRRGAFTPWHQTWHRAHPGFSAAQLGSPINPPAPLLLIPSLTFTASPPLQLQFLPPCLAAPLLLSISPAFSCSFLLQSLLSVSAFLLRHNAGHSAKKPSEHADSAQKCHRSLDFSLKIHSRSLGRVTLHFSFTEGSLFSIAPVWERVRCRSGREAAGLVPSWRE